MTAKAKWLYLLGCCVALLLIGIGLAGEDTPPPRAPGPDLEAALAACRTDLAVHHAHDGEENTVRPWTLREPGDTTRRAR